MLIEKIKEIIPPTYDEIEKMNLELLIEWRDKLYPFYVKRTEILFELGFEEWRKVIGLWPTLYLKVENYKK